MKKIFLTSGLVLCISCPAIADINKDASTATCDSATIGATSGSAYMDTDWTANTINLDFYSDGEKISTGSCTYDGAIELPEDPEDKTGYTFGGWVVHAVVPVQSGEIHSGEPEEPETCDLTRFSSAKRGNISNVYTYANEWAIGFEENILARGRSFCSPKRGEYADVINYSQIIPNDYNGETFCWCQLDNLSDFREHDCEFPEGRFIATDTDYEKYYGKENCDIENCAEACANIMQEDEKFMDILFGQK